MSVKKEERLDEPVDKIPLWSKKKKKIGFKN